MIEGGNVMSLRSWLWPILAVAGIVIIVFTSLEFSSTSASSTVVEKEPPETAVVEIVVPDRESADNLVEGGYELTGYASDKNGQLEVHAIVTEAEMEMLEMEGYELTVIQTSQDVERILEERERTLQQGWTLSSVEDNINVFRADYFTNQSGTFLYLEAKSSAGPDVSMNAAWVDENGEEQTASMSRNVDYGEYLYHYVLTKIDSVPENVVITSSQQGSAETELTEWIGDGTPVGDDYLKDFITHYMEPMEIEEKIIELAEEFPELAEIVELPYE